MSDEQFGKIIAAILAAGMGGTNAGNIVGNFQAVLSEMHRAGLLSDHGRASTPRTGSSEPG